MFFSKKKKQSEKLKERNEIMNKELKENIADAALNIFQTTVDGFLNLHS